MAAGVTPPFEHRPDRIVRRLTIAVCGGFTFTLLIWVEAIAQLATR